MGGFRDDSEQGDIPNRLTLTLLDDDPDYLLFRVAIADGAFAGSTRVYEGRDVIQEIRSALGGFPRSSSDQREVVLGTFGPESAGGAVRLVFRTLNRAGHAILEAEIEDEPSSSDSPRTAVVRMRLDAADIDQFLGQLETAMDRLGGKAVLNGVE